MPDWALGVAGIPYTMAMELRGSPGGWALPPEYIRPSGEEVWAFHTTAAQLIIGNMLQHLVTALLLEH